MDPAEELFSAPSVEPSAESRKNPRRFSFRGKIFGRSRLKKIVIEDIESLVDAESGIHGERADESGRLESSFF